MKSVIVLGMSMLLLNACGGGRSDQQLTAPDVQEYGKGLQQRAADEMQSGACSALTEFTIDHGIMRDQSRSMK